MAPVGQLDGTVALITGGGRGVGRVLAHALAGAGAAVGLVARSAEELAETVKLVEADGGVAAAATADVTDRDAATAAVEDLRRQLGPVDLLINNAGMPGPAALAWEVDPDEWWRTMEVNLGGVFLFTHLVVPEMVSRQRGRVVNITSRAGVFRWPMMSAYVVSKGAVVKFTENLAHETRRHGVTAFSVHPGILPIGFSEAALADDSPPDSIQGRKSAWIKQMLSDGRGADPAWVADLLLRIAAGELDALSGRHITVHDDLDAALARIGEVEEQDLYLMRVRTIGGGEAT